MLHVLVVMIILVALLLVLGVSVIIGRWLGTNQLKAHAIMLSIKY